MKDVDISSTYISAPTFLSQPDEDHIEWLVEDLIPSQTIGIFLGMPKNYKTYFTLCMAKAVSSGSNFLGRKTHKTPIFYTDRENPRRLMRDRFNQLGLLSNHDFNIWGKWMDITPPKYLDHPIYKEVAKEKGVIIFDSLIRFHDFDENKPMEMKKVTEELSNLQSLGATIWIIHHRGKSYESYHRGTTEIIAGVDIAYCLEKSRKHKNIVKLICTDSRYFPEFELNLKINSDNGLFYFSDDTKEQELIEQREREEKARQILGVINVYYRKNKEYPNQTSLVQECSNKNIGSFHHIRDLIIDGDGTWWEGRNIEGKTIRYIPILK